MLILGLRSQPLLSLLRSSAVLHCVETGTGAGRRATYTSEASESGSSQSSPAGQPPSPDSQLIRRLQQDFTKDPRNASELLARALTPTQRAVLTASLAHRDGQQQPPQLDDEYADLLFDAADRDGDKNTLTRVEFKHALDLHSALEGSHSNTPPSWTTLRMVFVASAIPFVGFGFLDNFIMLVAGEEIDALFGARLGLSTLASAGLGNLVADVIGVGAANGIEQRVRQLPYIRDFKLTKHQAAMRQTKVSKMFGATAGVMVGCVLGLAPLFWSGTFFVK